MVEDLIRKGSRFVPKRDMDFRLIGYLLTTVFMWGLWGFFGKLALDRKMAPMNLFVAEIAVSLLCLIPAFFWMWNRKELRLDGGSWNVFGLYSGGALAVGLLAYYFALERGQAGVIVPLTSVYPVLTVLLSAVFLRERLGPQQWIAVSLIILGVVLLLVPAARKPLP